MQIITLKNGHLVCKLAPARGGSVVSFDYGTDGKTQHLMRPTADLESPLVTDFACWPLVPYSNRINKGRFTFENVNYEIPVDYLGPPHHASHGQGWKHPWQVRAANDTCCDMDFVFDEIRYWPFPYKAEQNFTLDDKGLTIRLSVTNTGTKNMPAGLGQHPYFPHTPGTTLKAEVGHLWENDAHTIPSRRIAVPAEYEFSTPKSLDQARLDNCFDGYGGKSEITWPGEPMKLEILSSSNLAHFVVYTPSDKDFFCAEPVSHKPNAVNNVDEPDNGLVVLRPGQSLEANWRFQIMPA